MVPQLHHLFLRYCKRLTDNAVDAIALNMPNLFSLDLSFCSRLSAAAIVRLLDWRWETLAELVSVDYPFLERFTVSMTFTDTIFDSHHHISLSFQQRLQSCNLQLSNIHLDTGRLHSNSHAGRQILYSLRRHGDGCCLSVLDLRPSLGNAVLAENDPFVQGMKALSFEQPVQLCFVRPSRWNPQIEQFVVNQSFATKDD
jgi:hypothetical protein